MKSTSEALREGASAAANSDTAAAARDAPSTCMTGKFLLNAKRNTKLPSQNAMQRGGGDRR